MPADFRVLVATDGSPSAREKRRFGAGAIVLGWGGHGSFRRLLAGSVSRALVARADCPVLVARAAPRAVRRIVVGFDDCPNARRAVQFLGQLNPPRASVIWLVNVVAPLLQPPTRRLPRASASVIRSELARLTRERYEEAAAKSEAAAAALKKRGWRVRTEVRTGAPLEGLLAAARERRADVVAAGARATSGLGRALLGSVAAGLLDRSPVPVLVVP